MNLDSREISDDGLRHLQTLHLKSLDIFSGRISDTGCSSIAKIKSLESLELCGGGIGDLGCTLLATLDNLTSLNLSQNERITNRGAAALAALTNLKALNLSNTRVNSSSLRFLSGLLKLQSLALYGCRGIEEGKSLDKLQNGLPSLKCLRLNKNSEDEGQVVLMNDDEGSDLIDDEEDEGDDGSRSVGDGDQNDEDQHMFAFPPHLSEGATAVAVPVAGPAAMDEDDDEDFYSDHD